MGGLRLEVRPVRWADAPLQEAHRPQAVSVSPLWTRLLPLGSLSSPHEEAHVRVNGHFWTDLMTDRLLQQWPVLRILPLYASGQNSKFNIYRWYFHTVYHLKCHYVIRIVIYTFTKMFIPTRLSASLSEQYGELEIVQQNYTYMSLLDWGSVKYAAFGACFCTYLCI